MSWFPLYYVITEALPTSLIGPALASRMSIFRALRNWLCRMLWKLPAASHICEPHLWPPHATENRPCKHNAGERNPFHYIIARDLWEEMLHWKPITLFAFRQILGLVWHRHDSRPHQPVRNFWGSLSVSEHERVICVFCFVFVCLLFNHHRHKLLYADSLMTKEQSWSPGNFPFSSTAMARGPHTTQPSLSFKTSLLGRVCVVPTNNCSLLFFLWTTGNIAEGYQSRFYCGGRSEPLVQPWNILLLF